MRILFNREPETPRAAESHSHRVAHAPNLSVGGDEGYSMETTKISSYSLKHILDGRELKRVPLLEAFASQHFALSNRARTNRIQVKY